MRIIAISIGELPDFDSESVYRQIIARGTGNHAKRYQDVMKDEHPGEPIGLASMTGAALLGLSISDDPGQPEIEITFKDGSRLEVSGPHDPGTVIPPPPLS